MTRIEFEEACREICEKHMIREIPALLMRKSLKIPKKGLKVRNEQYEAIIYPAVTRSRSYAELESKLGTMCYKGRITAFIYCDGNTYISDSLVLRQELINSGFRKGHVYVPLTNGEIIADEKLAEKWEQIRWKKKK